MSNNLYIPLHPADYLADAAHLTTLEHGAYFLLILNYWQRGEPLPADDRKLARICRLSDADWADVKPSLFEFFTERDGLWVHKRIEAELVKANERSAKARASASNRYASVKQTHCERTANALPSQIERNANQEQEQEQEKEIVLGRAGARSKNGSRLPLDWAPSRDLVEKSASMGLSAAQFDREIEKFKNHWQAQAGPRGVKNDWDAAARNWMITAVERLSPPPRISAAPKPTTQAVWLKRGSPQWQAWTKSRGKEPYFSIRNGDEGAFFRTEWPEQDEVAA